MYDAGKVGLTMEGTHDSTRTYEKLSVVSNSDSSKLYISKKNVPAGTLLTNTEYWHEVLNLNLTDVVIGNSISLGRKADTTIGTKSVAEGHSTTASGDFSHAEGDRSTASGDASHAECRTTTASGYASHAEGSLTMASGINSHAEGHRTTASGDFSHASGYYTNASSENQFVIGKYNIEDIEGKYAFIIGNGTDEDNRSNALAIKWDGTIVTSNF